MPERRRRRRKPKERGLLERHPAETKGALVGWGGSAGLVAAFGLDGWGASLIYLAGQAVPLGWTFLRTNGGIAGVWRRILRGD